MRDGESVRQTWYHLHPRQQSAQLFLLPALYAGHLHYPLGVGVYGTNWAVSTLTHSMDDALYTRWHIVDLIAITFWGAYNSLKVFRTLHTRGVTAPLLLALMCALCTCILHAYMQRYRYESNNRRRLHISMHIVGVMGTLLLLYASQTHLQSRKHISQHVNSTQSPAKTININIPPINS